MPRPRRRPLEFGVDAHEIVVGTPRLEVRAPSALDADTARGAISVGSIHGRVALSEDRRSATFVPDEPLPPGPHTLRVGELAGTRGARLSEPTEVPFFVSDSSAKVPPELRIESIVRLRVGELGPCASRRASCQRAAS